MTRAKGYITKQAKRLSAGEINRRRFVMAALSAGVTMPTAMSLATRAEAMVPRKGGLLRQATAEGSLADKLDPVLASNGFTRYIASARGDTLTEIVDGRATGNLAEEVHSEDAGRRWIFRLRQNVEFHNGQTLTPEDVIATLIPLRRTLQIADLKKDGEQSVIVLLKQADTDFDRRLSNPRFVILPADTGGMDPRAVPGTGGYVLTDFVPGKSARFMRNANYWKQGAAHFDAVEILSIPDTKQRQHAVANGDVHVADCIEPKTVALMQRLPTLEIVETDGTQDLGVALAQGTCAFDRKFLRHALSLAVPRQELVDKVLLGHGQVAKGDTDLERANQLYRASGHAGTITFAASDTAFPGAVDMARLIAASAREALIEIDVLERTDDGADAYTAILSDSTPSAIPVMRANAITAHARTLARGDWDTTRIAENWWFV